MDHVLAEHNRLAMENVRLKARLKSGDKEDAANG